MPIRLLPPEVAARIAAGEVVERPASAVKELVENALDAGATAVRIETTGGGLESIRVVDNGVGISPEDARLLFQRHATSKLANDDGLGRVATLGFRGEALHSLTAVADVEVLTRTAAASAGLAVRPGAGGQGRQTPRGAPQGTSATVRGLFQDIPARRKFLRSPQAETARIQAAILPYVLAYPAVRITLVADGRASIASPGDGTLREAVAAIYGGEVARSLLEVSSEGEGPMTVAGLTSPPDLHRANRGYITLFVNGRPVQSRSLTYAVAQAYQGFLPVGRNPIAVLFLTVPPDEVDVNVHPTKAEVRLTRERDAFAVVQRAVREAVVTGSPVPHVAPLGPATRGPSAAPRFWSGRGGHGVPPPDRAAPWPATTAGEPGRSALAYPPPPGPAQAAPEEMEPGAIPQEGLQSGLLPVEALPALRVLGQTQETYIVAEGPTGLYLIDQHAAHERVLYERVLAAAARLDTETQGLLAPVVEELSPLQDDLAASQGELLARYGWLLEPFGPRSYLVRGVPAVLARRAPAQAFLDVLDSLLETADLPSWEERIAATVACHGAVRAGETLTREEMGAMIRDLELARQPQTCPHGRPTMVHLSSSFLDREFRRR